MLSYRAILLFLSGILLFNPNLTFSDSPEKINQNTVIEIGDELKILLEQDAEFTFRGPVDASGNITLPYVGEVGAASFTLSEFKNNLEKILLEQFYKEVTLSVSIIKQGATHVYVYGAVQEPGAIEVSGAGRISLLQALAAVKGLTAWANPKESYILRADENDGQSKESIDIQSVLSRLSQKGLVLSKEGLVYLYAGDELYVPGLNQNDNSELLTTTPREVIVVGQVNAPGIQLFAPGEEATLMRAIFKCGGMTQFAQGNKVKLIRYEEEGRSVQIVDINRVIEKGYLEEDVDLNSGDMIIVPQKFVNF